MDEAVNHEGKGINSGRNSHEPSGVTPQERFKVERNATSNSPKSDRKPYFILHVGPYKSGTTTIQDGIQNPHMKYLLRQDHYWVVPHMIIHNNTMQKFRNKERKEGTHKFDNILLGIIRETVMEFRRKRPGFHIFGSSEYLHSPGVCEAWKQTFMEEQRLNMQIVLTYRRLHSYLPSIWNQNYKYNMGLQPLTPETIQDHPFNWPGTNGGFQIPSFEDFYLNEHFNKNHLHPVIQGLNNWRECSDGITIFNMNDSEVQLDGGSIDVEDDLVTNFICKEIKRAKKTCSELLLEKKNNKRRRRLQSKNKSVNLDYDMLAVHAYDSGLIGGSHTRLDVAKEIETYASLNRIDLPQKCPNSTVVDSIYKWSLESEQWVISRIEHQKISDETLGDIEVKPLSAGQLLDFNTDWEQTLVDKKFCSVDGPKTLKQESWQEFFRSSFQ